MDDISLVKLMESALREEYEQYEKLSILSREQSDLFDSNSPDAERIAELMNQKIEVMETLQNLQKRNEPLKERWTISYETFTEEERKPIAELREQNLRIIEDLKNQEEQIAKKLLQSSQEVNEQLQSLSKGRQATRAYLKMDSMPPRFIDKKK